MKNILFVLCCLSMLCSFLNAQVNLENGLVAHYPFNGNANNEIDGNNSAVSGAQLTTDRFGNNDSAYEFDGIDDYIDCGDEPEFQFSSDFSISVWIYFLGDSIQASIIAKRNFNQDYNQYNIGFMGTPYGPHSVDYPTFFVRQDVYQGVGQDAVLTLSQHPLEEGWHHIVVCNDLNGSKLFYLNGVLVVNINKPQQPVNVEGHPFYIGNLSGSASAPYKGKIDDIRVYNRCINAAEVTALYNLTTSVVEPEKYQLSVFPNPVKDGKLNFTSEIAIKDIRVFSLNGKEIQAELLDKNSLNGVIQIDTQLPEGVYILKLTTMNNEEMVYKFKAE